MFLALFPYSEVFYAISILLTWLYIALGIIGNSQTAKEEVIAYKFQGNVQESHFLFNENINFTDRNYIWENCSDNFTAEVTDEPAAWFHFFSIKTVKYKPHHEYILSCCLDSNVPNRAPPSFIY